MPSPTHRIVRSTLDVRVPPSQESGVLGRLRARWDDVCVPSLEAAFDAVAGDSLVRVDRLEVDVGALPSDDLTSAMAERLQRATVEALEKVLREQGSAAAPDWQRALPEHVRDALDAAPSDRPREQHRALESAAHLLVTGRSPWWEPDAIDLDRAIRSLLDAAPDSCTGLLRSMPPALAARRLARQLSPPLLDHLVRHLGPASMSALASTWTDALAAMYPGRDPVWGADAAWEAVLVVLLEAEDATDVEAVWAQVHERVAATVAAETGSSVPAWKARAVRRAGAALPSSVPWTDRLPGTADPSSGGDAPSSDPGREPSAGAPSSPEADDTPESDRDWLSEDHFWRPESWDEAMPLSTGSGPDSGGGHAGPPARPDAEPDVPFSFRDSSTNDEHEAALASPLDIAYVDDAGLALLAPFLTTFFETLDLTSEGAFVDREAHGRAVLLTRFLATGTVDVPEPNLALAALLCGWPGTEPLPRRLTLTDVETAETTTLMTSVIEHWVALKNTSPDGLRRTFLLRDGKLERQPRQWHLTVDRHGVDVLVDTLPWGISVISLPWMSTPLFVSW